MGLNFSAAMDIINLISFNVNGCRQSFKRTQLFELLEQKRAGVAFLQETHRDTETEAGCLAEWRGQCVLSHGVDVLFKPGLDVDILHFKEIIRGLLVKARAKIGEVIYDFINIYAPNLGKDSFISEYLEADSLNNGGTVQPEPRGTAESGNRALSRS